VKNNKFLISIVTPTLNNEKDIIPFLNSIERQTYPKSKIEILIMDGGSTDKTVLLAKKHNAKVIKNPYVYADPGVDLGIKRAKGDLVMILATDNVFKEKNAIERIVSVFSNKKIKAAFPKQDSKSSDTVFSKYINTFTDPFSHFVYGDACNPRTFKRIYKTIESNDIYDIYDYSSSDTWPLIAFAQGFTIRSGYSRKKNDQFDDLVPVIKMIQKNEMIAYIHSVSLYHHTIKGFAHFIEKQIWRTKNILNKRKFGISHRVSYLSEKEKLRIKIWPLYAFSIIFPVLDSVYGMIRDKEILWAYHPFMCFASATASLIAVINFQKERIIK